MKTVAKLSTPATAVPRVVFVGVLLAIVLLTNCAQTEISAQLTEIKIGLLRSVQNGAVYIANEKGYFAAEGLAARLTFFNTAQEIPAAVASYAVDFAAVGTTASLYRLANEGRLRIIAGAAHEAAGYQLYGLAVSRQAYQAGLKSFKDIPGHSVSIATIGAPAHYSLALIAERYGFDLSAVRIIPLQSYANMVSAVSAGQADAGIIPATEMKSAISNGALQVIGWIGDEVPWQVSVVFTASEMTNERADTVMRFLRAYRLGARDYHDAFADADGRRKNGRTAAQIVSIIARYIGHPTEQIASEIAYVDPEARLDVKDVLRQISWYRAQGLLSSPDNREAIVDKRYVLPLPER
jgi:NitT/TauT family transport system substrate-binding protein